MPTSTYLVIWVSENDDIHVEGYPEENEAQMRYDLIIAGGEIGSFDAKSALLTELTAEDIDGE